MAQILVPDYLGQHTLSGIRALARAGDSVDLANDAALAQRRLFRSRAIRRVLPATPAHKDPDAYLEDVISLLKAERYDALLPFGLDAYQALVPHGESLSSLAAVLLPEPHAFDLASDKEKMAEFCAGLGISAPRLLATSIQDVSALSQDLVFPVVVKATHGSGVASGLRYANNRDELLRACEELSGLAAGSPLTSSRRRLVIQEFVPGYIHDACTLSTGGRPVAILTQVRELMNPVSGGVGAVNITTDNSTVRDLAARILEAIGWTGPAQIEFKCDSRDGSYRFIEFNPKLWGTLDLSIKAGVPFPVLIRDICLGKKVRRDLRYKAGIRYLFTHPQAYFASRQLGAEGIRLRQVFTRPATRTCRDIDFSDPLPDLYRIYRVRRQRNQAPAPNSNLSYRQALGLEPAC